MKNKRPEPKYKERITKVVVCSKCGGWVRLCWDGKGKEQVLYCFKCELAHSADKIFKSKIKL